MDYTGIPLAICMDRGNQNEQTTLIPLEKKILQDFELAKFVVCTDAGLRIKAHFMTCFIALLVYRILERKLGNKYTCDEIVSTLRSMRVTKAKDLGYIPSYTRTDLTDSLHESAGFRTDYEITRDKAMRSIVRKSKQR